MTIKDILDIGTQGLLAVAVFTLWAELKRNRALIEQLLLYYVKRESGGAYQREKIAEATGAPIVDRRDDPLPLIPP